MGGDIGKGIGDAILWMGRALVFAVIQGLFLFVAFAATTLFSISSGAAWGIAAAGFVVGLGIASRLE